MNAEYLKSLSIDRSSIYEQACYLYDDRFINIRLNINDDPIGDCKHCSAKGAVMKLHDCTKRSKDNGVLTHPNVLIDRIEDFEKSFLEGDQMSCATYLLAVQRAKKRGIPFEISFKRYKALRRIKYCFYTGVLLDKENSDSDNAFTLDRMDPDKGYTDSNVVVCCLLINKLKANLTPVQIQAIYIGLKRKDII